MKTNHYWLAIVSSIFISQAHATGSGLYLGFGVGATSATAKSQTVYTSPYYLPLTLSPSGVLTDTRGQVLFATPGTYNAPFLYQIIAPAPGTKGRRRYVQVSSPVTVSGGTITAANGTVLPPGQYQLFNAETIKPKSPSGLGERLFIGYRLNSYAGVELGYAHYAPTNYNTPKGTIIPTSTPQIRQNVVDLDGIVYYPLSKFSIFGKLGAAVVRDSTSGSMQPPNKTGNGGTTTNVRPLIGVGVSYDLTQKWVVDFSVTRILGGTTIRNSNFAGIGFSYHLNDRICGQFLCDPSDP